MCKDGGKWNLTAGMSDKHLVVWCTTCMVKENQCGSELTRAYLENDH